MTKKKKICGNWLTQNSINWWTKLTNNYVFW
jgi:hypothetical protein